MAKGLVDGDAFAQGSSTSQQGGSAFRGKNGVLSRKNGNSNRPATFTLEIPLLRWRGFLVKLQVQHSSVYTPGLAGDFFVHCVAEPEVQVVSHERVLVSCGTIVGQMP